MWMVAMARKIQSNSPVGCWASPGSTAMLLYAVSAGYCGTEPRHLYYVIPVTRSHIFCSKGLSRDLHETAPVYYINTRTYAPALLKVMLLSLGS